jgi:hypothetical protein
VPLKKDPKLNQNPVIIESLLREVSQESQYAAIAWDSFKVSSVVIPRYRRVRTVRSAFFCCRKWARNALVTP